MSVAQKDGIKAADGISYDDLYRRWEQSNWQATAIDFAADREGWDGAHRHPATLGAVDLLDVLLRRGLGHRQPLPLHRRGAEGGAEVLPRHPAGRRGAPRGLLPPLLQGGDRRRRLDRLDPRLHRAAAQLGLPQRLRPARPDGRRPAPRPLAAELRPRDRALPHGRRGDPGPARPALHRGLLRQRRDDARLQRGDGERLARRAAPHRLRGQGALRVLRRVGRVQGRRSPSCCARCCPFTARASSSPPNWDSSTPAATASSSRTSSPSACARCGPSGARPATRWRRCPACCRSTPRSRPRRSPTRQIKLLEGRA